MSCTRQKLLASFVLLCLFTAPLGRCALAGSGLVSNIGAQRNGLVRAWFSHAQVDPSQHRVERALLAGDQLFVLTTAGVLHAMDAETGETRWVASVGNPDYPTLGPAANGEFVAMVNGSTVVVLRRQNGLVVMSRQLGGGPGGGPALTERHVFVPQFSGKIEAYPLDENKRRVNWYYASTGRIFHAPTATGASVAWPTDRGFLYVANPGATGVRYRFESSGQINPEPAAYDDHLYATSSNGYLYCLNELTGQQRWRYSTGSATMQSPAVVAGRVYVATQQPALHCVSAASGAQVWQSPDIAQLVGVSETRIYGMDRMGRVRVLDKASGVTLGSMSTSIATRGVLNEQTDRLYLVSETGLVQCLHEIGADEPTLHVDAAAEEEPGPEAADEAPDAALPEPGDQQPDEPGGVNPFGPPAGEVNPFGEPAESPFGEEADTANPFDF